MSKTVPFYNVANMFFVGCVFVLLLCPLVWGWIPFDSLESYSAKIPGCASLALILSAVAMFEVGFIINRLGSLIVESVYVRLKIWPKSTYDADVSEISKENQTFWEMKTELNILRSHVMMCLILLPVALWREQWIYAIAMLVLAVVFTLSGRKHNEKINVIRQGYARHGTE